MWRKQSFLLGVAILVLGVSFALLLPKHVAALNTGFQDMSFEGKIVTSAGINIPDGTYNMEFDIYTGCTNEPASSTGCTSVWTEDWLVHNTQGVAFTSGTFQANLGSITALPVADFILSDSPLYLSIQIGDTGNDAGNCVGTTNFHTNCGGDGVMNPYIALSATPYSLNSGELGGIAATGFAELTPGAAQTLQPSVDATGLTVKGSAAGTTQDIFDVQTSGSGDLIQTTGAGALTLSSQGTTQTLSITTAASTTAATGGISIVSGNATSGTNLSAGTVYIDTGTQTGNGHGIINIGTSNADSINIGNTSATTGEVTTINGGNNTTAAIALLAGNGAASSGAAGGAITVTAGVGGINGTTGQTGGSITVQGGAGGSSTAGGTGGAISIQGGAPGTGTGSPTYGAVSLQTLGNGAVTVGATANTGTLTFGQSTSGETIDIGNGALASGTETVDIGTGATSSGIDAITLGSTNGASSLLLKAGSANVVIGSATTSTTQVLLQLDSFSTYADTATCATTTNQGALYYNTNTNSVRGCLNGAWTDLLSTQGLGLLVFGIVSDSGTDPGDIAGVAATNDGPCKAYVGSTTSTIAWNACTAYSGGRKVLVTAGSLGTTNTTLGDFQHLCISPTTGQPTLSTAAAEATNLGTSSFPSASAPNVCLADIKFGAANSTITTVYDTRVFTTTEKVLVTDDSASGLGDLVAYTATKGTVVNEATLDGNGLAGVIVAGTGAASTNTINAVMAVGGPTWVKATAGTVAQYIFGTATSGYAATVATKPTESTSTIYNVLGESELTWSGSTTCATNLDSCEGSLLTYIDKR